MTQGSIITTDKGFTVTTELEVEVFRPTQSTGFFLTNEERLFVENIRRIGKNYKPVLDTVTSRSRTITKTMRAIEKLKGSIEGIRFDFRADLLEE